MIYFSFDIIVSYDIILRCYMKKKIISSLIFSTINTSGTDNSLNNLILFLILELN